MSLYYKAHVSLTAHALSSDEMIELSSCIMLDIDSRQPAGGGGDSVVSMWKGEHSHMSGSLAASLARAGQTLIELSKLMEVK